MRALLRRVGWERCVVLVLLTITVVQNALWIRSSTAMETWDDDAGLYHLATCIEDGLNGLASACFAGAPYPPLVPSIAGLHFWLTSHRSLQMALHSLWLWPILLCVCLYVGLRREGGRWAGLAGVTLGPVIVWALHIRGKFYTEVPLAALIVASIVCWVMSDGFRRRGASCLLGLFLALGLLTKWSFAFFLAPPMAVAWAIGLSNPLRGTGVRWGIRTATMAAIVVIGLGAAGTWRAGLAVGPLLFLAMAVFLIWRLRARPQDLEEDAASRWINVALASSILMVIAGPWYLNHLSGMQAFLTDNLTHRFHGDPIAPIQGLPFYPAVLLTRVLSTPLALLFLFGLVRALFPKRSPLAVWSLAALVSGAFILGILPYRAGRYLVAGFGLATPLIVMAVASPRGLARLALPTLMVAGLLHQLSWIPLFNGWVRVPHHWSVFTLPQRDLFGNSQQGIIDATRDLLTPRWRFLPVASPPVMGTPAPRRILSEIRTHTGSTPFLAVIVDPQNKISVNSLRTERLAVRPPPTSDAVQGDVQATTASIRHWRHQARHPPDTPDKVLQGPMMGRTLYIATVRTGPEGPTPLDQLLQAQGWKSLFSETLGSSFDPATVTVWAEPQQTRWR